MRRVSDDAATDQVPLFARAAVRRTLPFAVLVMVATAAVFTLFPGCGGRRTASTANGDEDGESTAQDEADQCENLLSSARDMLEPGRYGVTADADGVISLLNEWKSSCEQPATKEAAAEAVASVAERLLDEELLDRVRDDRFRPQDAVHVRNSLLLRSAAGSVTADVQRVVQLFEFVVRNVRLTGDDNPTSSLSPYHALVFGRGSARDRAWTFAALLRQLRIDAVVLAPPMETDGKAPAPLLVGVLLEDDVYLFEPRLGLPVPAAGASPESPLVERPATLAAVLEDESPLREFDVEGRPYPVTAANLAESQVLLVGNTSLWSPRMIELRFEARRDGAAAGDDPLDVVLYDPLDDVYDPGNDVRLEGSGAFSRVAKFPGRSWEAEDVGVWPYPERCLQRSLDPPPEVRDAVRERMDVLSAPLQTRAEGQRVRTAENLKDSPLGEEVVAATRRAIGAPTWRLLQARLDHLRGDDSAASLSYVHVRNERNARVDKDPGANPTVLALITRLRELHDQAGDDAMFWSALLKIDRDVGIPIELREYLRIYESGDWVRDARVQLAIGLARAGSFDRAVQELSSVLEDEDFPGRDGFAVLLERWQRLAAQERSKTEPGGESEPADDAAEPGTADEAEPSTNR